MQQPHLGGSSSSSSSKSKDKGKEVVMDQQQHQQQQQQQQEEKTAKDEIMASGTLPPLLYQNRNEYAPATRDVMRVLCLLGQRDGKWLIRAVFQALFGTPRTAHDLAMLWFRTVSRAQVPAPSGGGGGGAAYGPADLLRFLATAPAAPCLRHHRVGGHQRHAVYLLPFGTGSELATHLAVPLAHADLRLVRSVQLLANNPWAFRHMEEDPVFGFFTLSCFAYSEAAQSKLDQCRPTLLAAAVRALAMQVRLEVAHTERTRAAKYPQTRELVDRRVLSQHPTYVRAVVEKSSLDRVRSELVAQGDGSPAHRLLIDALVFVLDERTFPSLPQPPPPNGSSLNLSKMGVPTVPYAVLPTDADLETFAGQTRVAWLAAISAAPPPATAAT